MHHSKGKDDLSGHLTDVWRVRWVKVFDDANYEFERREALTRTRRAEATVRRNAEKAAVRAAKRAAQEVHEKGEEGSDMGAQVTANTISSRKEISIGLPVIRKDLPDGLMEVEL